jgi:hypothetical protein
MPFDTNTLKIIPYASTRKVLVLSQPWWYDDSGKLSDQSLLPSLCNPSSLLTCFKERNGHTQSTTSQSNNPSMGIYQSYFRTMKTNSGSDMSFTYLPIAFVWIDLNQSYWWQLIIENKSSRRKTLESACAIIYHSKRSLSQFVLLIKTTNLILLSNVPTVATLLLNNIRRI